MKHFFAFLLAICIGTFAAADEFAEVRVTVKSPADVDRIERAGFVVGNLRNNEATVYLLRADLPALNRLGYTYEEIQPEAPEKAFGAYHNHAQLTTDLEAYAADYPNLVKLTSIGDSVQGRELWVMTISDNPTVDEEEPEFKYVSTMHGDEPIGTELCLYLIDHLLNNYGTDERITELVNETSISLLPMMNPDGVERVRRQNNSGIDLNRNFPTFLQFGGTLYDGAPINSEGRAPETRAVMAWSVQNSFVLSANFHSGALVFNYLFDDTGGNSGVYAACPDDDLVLTLALEYATRNEPMYENGLYPQGVVNGAVWYVANGSMQDWNYRYLGTIEATIELSETKKPSSTTLPTFWENNRESMLAYIEAVHWGIRGRITDRTSGTGLFAKVSVEGNEQPVITDFNRGDYYRLLLAGTYDLLYEAPGYIPYRVHGIAVPDKANVRVDVPLSNGDVDGDGQVGASDIQATVNAILQRPGAPNADVDGLGTGATDLQAVVNKALGR